MWMKLRTILIIFIVAVLGLVITVKYYGFDWNVLTNISFYEDLANPSVRIVRVEEGLRKEEIAEVMTKKLGWNNFQKNEFINAHLALNSPNLEGHYFPKTYMLPKDDDPFSVSTRMFHEFSTQTATIQKPKSNKVLNQDTILKVASIIQREAAGKDDMRLISGIIWNRIFNGMKLQIDATLQYAKGNEEDGWWEQVTAKDKKIDSPYNTYLHKDLPPSPIANPGLAAISAAYNPQKTSCLFFLHDKKRNVHCATTYEQHKINIEKYY